MLAAQMSVPSMSRELSLLPFWKRWGRKGWHYLLGQDTEHKWAEGLSKAQSQRGLQRPSLTPSVGHPGQLGGPCGAPLASPQAWALSLVVFGRAVLSGTETVRVSAAQAHALSSKPPRGPAANATASPTAAASAQVRALQIQAHWRVCVMGSDIPTP